MAGFKSLKGQLLLDGGQLRGSFFHRSVVLICQHDENGAFGLVLTQPTDNKLADALSPDLPESLKEHCLFLGGPVQPTALSFLHTDAFLPNASVMPRVNLGHDLEALVELGSSFSPSQQIKVFAGYAGWTAGQLEGELERKSWVVHPADIDLVFNSSPTTLWQEILRNKTWEHRLLADAPEDLAWN
ncbi:MAG TPA: YqgE/AlgH family protein [Methylomirabilota bacterium]|nr:YqgE/AlgH family protein [Methylomirabilota bacterium]